MSPVQYKTDIAIVGGGIAGLWLLNLLRDRGFDTVLLEKRALGNGQTVASQGMIHGGIKYALGGLLTDASETIAAMPARWQACLDGCGELDLRGVKTLSTDYYLFSDARLTSKITAFFGSKAIDGRVKPVSKEHAPEALRHQDFKGLIYQLQDLVLDPVSLLEQLARRHADSIRIGDIKLDSHDSSVRAITLAAGSLVKAKLYIFAAGSGNGPMIDQLQLPVTMQQRPLHQVVVHGGDLPALFAHAVSLRSADKPRLTITTHGTANGNHAWYLGGQLAETGVDRSDASQIRHAKTELSAIFPWLSFDRCQFSTHRIDRAEPGQKDQGRPDTPYARRFDNSLVCWPTKLTLAPMLGDMVLKEIDFEGSGSAQTNFGSNYRIGEAPWEADHEA